jgi:hypothetical protein
MILAKGEDPQAENPVTGPLKLSFLHQQSRVSAQVRGYEFKAASISSWIEHQDES